MSARIAIVSTKQPGTNPRMRKSATALSAAGLVVHVLYAYTGSWADEADRHTFQDAQWHRHRIGGHPLEDRTYYFISRLKRKIGRMLRIPDMELCPALNHYIQHLKILEPDLVIGHNPGSLPILRKWKTATNGKILFDAEDFHRGESYWVRVGREQTIVDLENSTFPQLQCITTASPLISAEYRNLYPHLDVVTINNAFPLHLLQPEPKAIKGPLQLVWFSQVLGLDRGLHEMLKGIAAVPDIPLSLTLIGMSDTRKQEAILNMAKSENHNIQFINPKPEESLLKLLSNHEIGLALEIGKPKNRDICRTNKLYTYPLAGCFILASQTAAQDEFLKEWPATGMTINLNDETSIQSALTWAFLNRDLLHQKRVLAWKSAQHSLNWEHESSHLVSTVMRLMES